MHMKKVYIQITLLREMTKFVKKKQQQPQPALIYSQLQSHLTPSVYV